MRNLLFIFVFLILGNISQAQTFTGERENFSIELTSQFYLQENLEFFDYPNGLFYTGSNLYVSANRPPMVIKYDINGAQLTILAGEGRGPAEFLRPRLLARKGDNFLVYDGMQLKFTEFTSQGQVIEDYTGVKFSVGNFQISDNKLFTYNIGMLNEPLIRALEIQGTKLSEYAIFDELTDVQLKLSRLSGTAPLATKGDILYYGHIDEPRIFWINLKTGKKGNKNFRDDLFSINNLEFSINDRAPNADEKWINFMFTNSSVRKIIPLQDFLIVEAQHGSMFDRSRTTVLHIFDYSLEKLDEVHFSHSNLLSYGAGIMAASGNEVVFIQNFADVTTRSGKYESNLEYRQQEGSGRKVTVFEVKKIK